MFVHAQCDRENLLIRDIATMAAMDAEARLLEVFHFNFVPKPRKF